MSVKKLGFGMMRLPLLDKNDEGSIDIELTKKMVDAFLERGFTYFDTAWMYCDFKSEEAVKAALVDRHARDSFTLTTKLHASYVHSLEDRDKIFNEQRRKTGVEYFDYYLLHDVNVHSIETYRRYDCYEWLKAKKAEGLVRHIAFSFHDGADFLDEVLTEWPEIEYVQLQLNYLDWDSAGVQSRRCYETAVKHGKKVIVMEPVKGGSLVNLPEDAQKVLDGLHGGSNASYAIRFAASFPGIRMVLSGMGSTEMMADNCGFMKDFQPLNEEERMAIARVCAIFRGQGLIPCTGCRYCTEVCPQGIPIPDLFACMNTKKQFHDWDSDYYYHDVRTKNASKASDCLKCGQCEDICPQHLNIRDLLEDVAKVFEK